MRTAWDQYALDARCMPEPRVRGFAMRSDTRMESDSGKGAKESGVRDRRYSIRYPFAADVEMLELESGNRRYLRISLPKGMRVAWHGGDLQLFSRVRTLSMGGLFIPVPDPPPVGTKLRLSFEVPGGNVHAEAIVRNTVPGEGMGVEFTRL